VKVLMSRWMPAPMKPPMARPALCPPSRANCDSGTNTSPRPRMPRGRAGPEDAPWVRARVFFLVDFFFRLVLGVLMVTETLGGMVVVCHTKSSPRQWSTCRRWGSGVRKLARLSIRLSGGGTLPSWPARSYRGVRDTGLGWFDDGAEQRRTISLRRHVPSEAGAPIAGPGRL